MPLVRPPAHAVSEKLHPRSKYPGTPPSILIGRDGKVLGAFDVLNDCAFLRMERRLQSGK